MFGYISLIRFIVILLVAYGQLGVGDLCIGCGICENRCPLEGKSAIVVEVGMVGGDS